MVNFIVDAKEIRQDDAKSIGDLLLVTLACSDYRR
jgi:hypothetical protein